MKNKLPKVRKTVSAFLTDEDGKISKQATLALGGVMGAAVLAGVLAATSDASYTHSNSIAADYDVTHTDAVTGIHSSHASHSSCHSSHSSCSCGCSPSSCCCTC